MPEFTLDYWWPLQNFPLLSMWELADDSVMRSGKKK